MFFAWCLLIHEIDGGGIRGVSQLIILDEIMKRIQAKKQLPEVPKPYEYFHLIGGSGTGGLNAIMLGRLKMSTEDALRSYNKLAAAVFSPDNHKPFYKDEKFKASILKAEIKEIVKHSHGGYTGDESLLDPNAGKDSIGNVFVCAKTTANLESPQRFRTYAGLSNQGPDCKVWEAVRATTATQKIFKSIMIAGPGEISSLYTDAGFSHNNPSKEVREEAMQLFGSDCSIGVFLSVGTGHPGPNGFQQPRGMGKFLPLLLLQTVTKIATDCESVSSDFTKQYDNSPGTYFRLNVIHGTGVLEVDDWQEGGAIILAHTSVYLREPNTSKIVEGVVECLCSSPNTKRTHTLGTFGRFYLFRIYRLKANMIIAGHITSVSKPSMIFLPGSVLPLFTGHQQYLSELEKYFAPHEKP
ncbi:acyl transferase/acyl hydrolase/lysophospholipase [Desarmillaria tabescens]|uniref:Acyl transferase/acyl hydrolase/lysophospholipase n=1 Tax=Armillaria tabescens TaxID=1929756 RepID=A0AA39J4V3_ARMTA|nr:acyl transferase/acyl hydrolase/lysophospholipase [Desarmillaria tabescens]KAK0435465.1 acyl transferase/acyl hydrolase/lysophospholipase [Desarmillaria tabescens]